MIELILLTLIFVMPFVLIYWCQKWWERVTNKPCETWIDNFTIYFPEDAEFEPGDENYKYKEEMKK